SAVWNVQLTIAGGPAAAATGSQRDVFELEHPANQTVIYSATGVGTATVNDTTNASLFSLVNTFTVPGSVGTFYTSQPGGIEHVVYQGMAGSDTLTYNTPANGTTGSAITYTPGVTSDAGKIEGQ